MNCDCLSYPDSEESFHFKLINVHPEGKVAVLAFAHGKSDQGQHS